MTCSPMTRAARDRDTARQKAEGFFRVWESRTQLVKNELAAASAANDAKTIRLRTLRLEKERQDAEAAAPTAAASSKIRGKRVRHIGG